MSGNKHLTIFLLSYCVLTIIIIFFLLGPSQSRPGTTSFEKPVIYNRSGFGSLAPDRPFSSQSKQDLEFITDLPENLQPQNLPQGLSVASLKPVGGNKGSAIAFRVLEGENLALAIEATITDPPAGEEYYTWLAKSANSQESYLLGKLVKTQDKYTLAAKPKLDLSNFNQVTVSLGKTDDNQPKTAFLQGSF